MLKSIFILLIPILTIAQHNGRPEKTIKISGYTICYTDTLSKMYVVLQINDSTSVRTYSDNNGHYELELSSRLFTDTSFSLTAQEYNAWYSSHHGDKPLPAFWLAYNNVQYFGFPKVISGKRLLNDTILQDLQIFRGCSAWEFPNFYFAGNSIELLNIDNEYQSDTALSVTIKLLKLNPSTIVQLAGHADIKEKKQQLLSEQRAKFIKSKLISEGIDEKRIKVIGFGASRPLSTSQLTDKKILSQKNRRVNIRIVSWDFDK